MRQRNLPAELVKAGAKLVLIPRNDDLDSFESWLRDVGEIVATGLDRDVALRAVTLEPATLLGLEERLGSLDEGKDANLILLNGDPLEVGTKIEAVMLDGRFVYGEVQ
jgi:imidazolonepropionase-like amidohydrolase